VNCEEYGGIHEVNLDRNSHLGDQIEQVKKRVGIPTGTLLENMRFRYNRNGRKGRVIEDLNASFADLNISESDTIFLEVKRTEEFFPEIEIEYQKLKVRFFNQTSMSPSEPNIVLVTKEAKVSELRAKCAEYMKIKPRQCKLYCLYPISEMEQNMVVMDIDDLSVDGNMMRDLIEVWADQCQDWESDETTPAFEYFEEQQHFTTYVFNRLGESDPSESINLDDRETLGQVRVRVGQKLGVDPMSFTVKRKSQREFKELKALKRKLCNFFIGDRRLYILEGKPLSEEEFRVCILRDTGEEAEDRFEPLNNNFVINVNWDLRTFYSALTSDLEPADLSEFPSFENMRVRKKFRERLSDFVPTGGTLRALSSMCDGYEIAIEVTKEPQILEKSDLILRLVKMRPVATSSAAEEEIEIIVNKNTKIQDFRKNISEAIGAASIPLEHLRFARAPQYPRGVDSLKWIPKNPARSLAQDGYRNGQAVVYCDARLEIARNPDEEEDVRGQETGSQGGGVYLKNGGGPSSAYGTYYNRWQPKERGIKILSAQEQEIRAQEERAHRVTYISDHPASHGKPISNRPHHSTQLHE